MKIILIIVIAIIVLVVGFCAYYGAFSSVSFKVEEQGGEVFVYDNMQGDYAQTPAVMDKVYNALLNDEKIATTKGAGVYFDDPRKVEKSKLRSEVGCIVNDADSARVNALSAKYLVQTLPVGKYVVAEFSYKGKMSIMFGIMKVYPALAKYCIENNLGYAPIMEIYDVPNKKIVYRKAVVQ